MNQTLMRSGFLSGISSVLLIGEDRQLNQQWVEDLGEEGLEVVAVHHATGAIEILRRDWVQAVVIIAETPADQVMAICRAIRRDPKVSSVPILLMVQHAVGEQVVAALRSGADDLLVQPIRPKVLGAKIRSMIRRFISQTQPDCKTYKDEHTGTIIQAGNIMIFVERHEVLLEGKPIHLTLSEFRLLSLFATKPNRVLHRDAIATEIYGVNNEIYERSVDSRVSMLRKKLGSNAPMIQSVRGLGYKLCLP